MNEENYIFGAGKAGEKLLSYLNNALGGGKSCSFYR